MRLARDTPARRADSGEIDQRATLVDARSERSRTRVRLPAPPLREVAEAIADIPPDSLPALLETRRAGGGPARRVVVVSRAVMVEQGSRTPVLRHASIAPTRRPSSVGLVPATAGAAIRVWAFRAGT